MHNNALSRSELIKLALNEDMPSGDITTDGLGIASRRGFARLKAKQDLTLSGCDFFEDTLKTVDPALKIEWEFTDADQVLKNQNVALIEGNLITLLKAERVALNFLGRLSGVATLTKRFVKQVEGTKTKILDTRKTTPLLRPFEKKAVRDGGGTSHRDSLSSAVLIKENHIRAADGINNAVFSIRNSGVSFIEVEVTTYDEAKECIELGVQRILLDNMSIDEMNSIVAMTPVTIETEASGNMTIDRVREVALTGVSFISVGALTHSAQVADLSLLFDWPNA
ncbi:MAG: nicotinate-nucleotide diphosphorylase (carboxylating) [Bdellovibrionales bacterium CG10_big_fil_rev_8_21_14_0_10_45_34]|nr:MAG: nicotinate-nucleotide diphosphorylase (carboxylating) [Bdellovibrionales bacterium CG10_big_fil_rev_8_21_14_0_10_45_34]